MPADDELNNVLNRRQLINEGKPISPHFARVHKNIYVEFKEFTRKQIKDYEKTFDKTQFLNPTAANITYDEGKDGYLDLEELKRMMEKLGAPQTHLDLKAMIKEVDEDGDNKISFREFLLIFRKANAGELIEESGLSKLAKLTEIDVVEVGVNGAKEFFEAKIKELQKSNKFEDEIRQEQEERRKEEEEKAQRRLEFNKKAAVFKNGTNGR